ncbi:hypothetical protein LNKW23_21750 [Paralimibaculum aggregatum]|uniref:Uncharacterized protein n=1 Tax=Paralimibaculum aggregatum TaxID=3036245 RepID=A0ABQ6LJ00_9RHOB|nr:hypothetical protein [Limibaculum sp. NKW23]GMG82962.1 hypothetical protein LNKW23_21750 [Limibaculum sp. NKW23]
MVMLYEALLGLGIVLLLRWLYRLWRRSGGGRAIGLAGLGAALAAFFWPRLLRADWAAAARIAAVAAIVGLAGLGYARLIARARRAAETRLDRGERER